MQSALERAPLTFGSHGAPMRRPRASPVWLLVIAVVVLAATLRLWRLDLTVYEIDEAALLRLAEDLVRLGHVPLSGPIFSAGIPSAPHFIYLLAPLVGVSRDPAFVSGAIAFANLLGIAATMWLAWRIFGWTAAMCAGVLYAVGPWAVFYARRVWQPDLLPPLAALLFVALDLAIVERRALGAIVSTPVAVLATLVHPSFAALLPFALAPIALLAYTRRLIALAVSITLSALLAAPTLVHEIQTRWVDVANIRYFTSLHTWLNLDSVQYALAVTTGWDASVDAAVPLPARAVPAWLAQTAAGLELVLLLLGVLLASAMLVRRPGVFRFRLAGLLAWLLVPILVTVRHSLPLQAHYFLILLPTAFILLGSACAWLLKRGPIERVVCYAAVTIIVATQGAWILGGIEWLGAHDDACYGPPLSAMRGIQQEIVSFGRDAGATHGAVELAADDALPIGYLLRSSYGAVDVAGNGAFGLGYAADSSDIGASAAPLLTHVEPRDVTFPDGIRVSKLAYSDQLSRGQRVALALTWTVDASATSNSPHVWRVDLVDASGGTVIEQSGLDHVPAALAGQRLVSWFTLDPSLDNDRVVVSGTYRLIVRLVDTWAPATLGDPIDVGSVTLGPPVRCST